ncbi:hypothetical protein GCM10011391_13690 [Pullulanibacillus camelliae]|uniref:Transposase DDE domain-containing protein n=1 Tax=Pullulanibacillus camelliae TaxID=1707096 RepID=A0A8J2VUT9_9BACL|nr:hypothetical protein GCM10011391_13690 [Pullulanibacillus camelliae]
MIAGYSEDDAADHLTNDPVFTQVIGTEALASQPSLPRFFRRFDDQSIEGLNQANQELLDKVHQHRAPEALILIWIPPMLIQKRPLTIAITVRLAFTLW